MIWLPGMHGRDTQQNLDNGNADVDNRQQKHEQLKWCLFGCLVHTVHPENFHTNSTDEKEDIRSGCYGREISPRSRAEVILYENNDF